MVMTTHTILQSAVTLSLKKLNGKRYTFYLSTQQSGTRETEV